MADEERTGSCITCFRRDPNTPLVCDVDRSKLRTWLREIPELFAEMVEAEPVLIPGPGLGGPVSGSKERPLPIRVDPFDLAAPARHLLLVGEDQVGYESVASVLDFWVRDWREARGGLERHPEPDVRTLATWLLRRADDACDGHPAVDEMFQDMARLRSALRGQLGQVEIPDYKKGVPCRRCDRLTLVRLNGSDWIECAQCPELLSPDEFDRWVGLLAAGVCGRKNGDWWCAQPRRHGPPCAPATELAA